MTQRADAQAIALSGEQFSRVFQWAPAGMSISRLSDGVMIAVNREFTRLLGYTLVDFAGRTSLDSGIWVDPGVRATLLRPMATDQIVENQEVEVRAKDGSIMTVRGSAQRLDLDGQALLVVAFVDVTERKRAEAQRDRMFTALEGQVQELTVLHDALQRSEERLTLALRAAGMGIWEMQSDRVTWSEELERIAGLPPGGFPGTLQAFRDMVHPEDLLTVEASIRAVADDPARGDVFKAEMRLVRPDHAPCWLASSGRVVRSADGKAVGMIGMAHDITGLRQLEQQYHQAQKMEAMGRLAGGVAHDFNNLLTAIKGYAELVIDRLEEGDRRRLDAQEIVTAADLAAGLTRQLLAFSRRQPIAPRLVDPNAVVAGLQKMLSRLIGDDIELTVALSPLASTVRVDPGQLEQVIVNLAVNARDAMPAGGALELRVSAATQEHETTINGARLGAGRYVTLGVKDTGTGMTDATRARIFEPFFTTKEQGRGTGLGLATVYGIVRQSEGAIGVESVEGAGSTFTVYLPLIASEAEAALAPAAVTRAVGGHETVVFVDGDPQIRGLAERALGEAGYRAILCASGAEAIRAIESGDAQVDVLVTDMVMPRITGRELAARFRAARPSVRVLFITGDVDREPDAQSLGAASNVLAKPFTPATLLQAVRDAIDRPTPAT